MGKLCIPDWCWIHEIIINCGLSVAELTKGNGGQNIIQPTTHIQQSRHLLSSHDGFLHLHSKRLMNDVTIISCNTHRIFRNFDILESFTHVGQLLMSDNLNISATKYISSDCSVWWNYGEEITLQTGRVALKKGPTGLQEKIHIHGLFHEFQGTFPVFKVEDTFWMFSRLTKLFSNFSNMLL